MRAGATSPSLIAREGEMTRLDAAMDVATEHGRAVVLIAGEAGIGKTRLVGELAARAAARRIYCCVGRCVDLGEATWPLAPLRDILASLVDDLDAEALDLVLGSARGVLAELVPELGGPRDDDEPVGRDRLCELVVGMISRLSRRGPVVLVVEDLHWADTTTRSLFTALAKAGRLSSVLLVGTFRSDEMHRRHPLLPMLAEIERDQRCQRIDLRPFDRAGTAALITAIGGPNDHAVLDDVHRRSAGNPFFVEELAAAGAQGGADLPETLRDVILARAAQLDDTAADVLGAAGAAGATLPAVLADVCAVDPATMRTTLGELFAHALLVPNGDEVRFRHELGREVFYDELAPGERARVHTALADSLERRRPERLGEIARHWSAAHDAPRALAASVAAGRQALRSGAAAEAEGHLGRALELWDAVDAADIVAGLDHAALLVETAEAAEHARHFERAIQLSRQAAGELADDPAREVEVWLQLRDLYRFMSRWDDVAVTVARALALTADAPPSAARAEALANASLSALVARRPGESLTHARQAIAVAELAGDANMVVKAHDVLVHALDAAGDAGEAVAVATVNVTRCGPGVSAERAVSAYNALTGALVGVDRYAEVPELAAQAVDLARTTGLGGPRAVWIALRWIETLVVLGDWSEAERVVEDLADFLDHPGMEGDLATCWGVALIRQGRLDEARPLVERARVRLASGTSADMAEGWANVVVMFDAAVGRFASAVALVDEFIDRDDHEPFGNSRLVATAVAAAADLVIGERDAVARRVTAAAGRWIEWLHAVEHERRPPSRTHELDEAHARAQFDRLADRSDPDAWAHLTEGWDELGFRYDAATARLHHAEALLAGAAGRSATAHRAATDVLPAAAAAADELRAVPLLVEVHDLARRAGLPIARTDPPDVDRGCRRPVSGFGLTPREQDVLALLAVGRSNGQIGKELFISTKTAGVHVSNILRKLHVANRVEAAAIADRT